MMTSSSAVAAGCTLVSHQAWCAGAALTQVPVLPHHNTTYLDLSRNRISAVSWRLQLYPLLVVLNLSNNSVSALSPGAFRGLSALAELHLAGNRLTTGALTPSVFSPLGVSLHYLGLTANLLGPALDLAVFVDLAQLTCLDLDYNHISVLTMNSGHNLDSLTELKLRGNSLTLIPHDIWPAMPNLVLLDLSENSISHIADRSFVGLTQLRALILNRMQPLKYIHGAAFVDAVNLHDLQISGCPQLTVIEPGAFRSNSRLRRLQLSSNGLSTLPEESINWQTVQQVAVYANPWSCDCRLSWISTVKDKLVSAQLLLCDGPVYIKGSRLADLDYQDFYCVDQAVDGDDLSSGQLVVIVVLTMGLTAGLVLLVARLLGKLRPPLARERTNRTQQYVYGHMEVAYGPLDTV